MVVGQFFLLFPRGREMAELLANSFPVIGSYQTLTGSKLPPQQFVQNSMVYLPLASMCVGQNRISSRTLLRCTEQLVCHSLHCYNLA